MSELENERNMEDLKNIFYSILFVIGLIFCFSCSSYCIIKRDTYLKKQSISSHNENEVQQEVQQLV